MGFTLLWPRVGRDISLVYLYSAFRARDRRLADVLGLPRKRETLLYGLGTYTMRIILFVALTMNRAFIQGRIDATKLQIVAYEDAALALGSGVQSYTLDTGQSRQQVTKLDLSMVQKTIDSLYNRCATLEARLNGSGTLTARPGW